MTGRLLFPLIRLRDPPSDETDDGNQPTPVPECTGMTGEEQMKREAQLRDVGHEYAAAHSLHYESKDLRSALDLYRGIVARYPDTREAEYSRSQIQNILNAVVPKQALFDAQIDLALAHCGPGDSSAPSLVRGEI